MKKQIATLVLIIATIYSSALGAQTPIDSANNIFPNLLPDPGFELGGYGWTASGGATKTANTTAKGTGSKGYDWDSNASSQTLKSGLKTIPTGWYGRNGQAYCNIKTPSGTATHTFAVDDGTNTINSTSIVSNTAFKLSGVNFTFPTSGSIEITLTSVASNEPEIYIDDCYIGLASNIGSGTTVTDWVAYTPTFTGFGSVTGVDFKSRRVGDTLEIIGNFTSGTSTATQAQITLGYNGINANVTTDSSKTPASGVVAGNGAYSGTGGGAFFPIVLNNANYICMGNSTAGAAGFNCYNGNGLLSSGQTLSIHVVNIPIAGWSGSDVFIRPDQQDYDWTAYTPTIGSGAGTATSISFYHKRSGSDLIVKGRFTAGTVAAALVTISLPGSIAIDTTKIAASNTSSQPGTQVGTYSGSTGAQHAGPVITATGTSTTVVYTGHTFTNAAMLTPTNASSGPMSSSEVVEINFRVPISGWIQTNPNPQIVGQVSSNTSGQEKIERALLDSACAVSRQSGSWISSTSHPATGECSVTISNGEFSSAPECTASIDNGGVGNAFVAQTNTTSATSLIVSIANGASAANGPVHIICMGPR